MLSKCCTGSVPRLLAVCALLLVLSLTQALAVSAISGVIRNGSGTALTGVTVALYSGEATTPTSTATTNTEGRFYFHELADGRWTVKPSRTGLTFSPVYRTYTLPPSVTEANFTGAEATTYGLAGTIKSASGAALSGVTVSLYHGDATTPTATKTTGTAGGFEFGGLAAGSWTVKPSRTGLTFSPTYRTYTLPPSVSAANFTGAETSSTSAITGVIKTAAGAALSGVTVSLYHGDATTPTATKTTGTAGGFEFGGLAAGSWTVKPSRTGMTFSPVHRTCTLPPSATETNFTGAETTTTSAIAGVVKNAAGAAVSGVSVGLYQNEVLKASGTTNAEGRYAFEGLAAGVYLVKPSQASKVLDPVSRLITVPPSVSSANFTIRDALSSICGTIKTSAGAAVAGASVSLYQGDVLKRTVLTNADGKYAFRELVAGTYVVRPSKDYLKFDPVSRSVAVPPNASGIGFIAIAPEPPRLRDGAVSPTSGTPKTVFTYSVIYRDALNRAPSSAVLVIDGTKTVTLTKRLEGDINYADDCIYQAKTTLALGTHKFRFVFRVGDHTLFFPGPTEAEYRSGPVVKPEYFVIGGTVSCGPSLLEGVTVTLTTPTGATRTATTNAYGRYVFRELVAGEYTVTPACTGYEFDPPHKSLVVGPSTETCNFAATILN